MEMCYDGALVMPNNYAVVNEEEMTYVEGGFSISSKWYGFRVTLSDHEAEVISNASNFAAAAALMCGFSGQAVPAAVSAACWLFSAEISLVNSFRHKGVTINITTLTGTPTVVVLPR